MHSYQLPELPYDFSALEPMISCKIMQLHYYKHHQGYVTNLNKALEQYQAAEQKKQLDHMIALQSNIKFNGGGHINHSILWETLAPVSKGGGEPPRSDLAKAIERDFGSFDQLIKKWTQVATGIQGSGWAWLGYDKFTERLSLSPCANQDPLMIQGSIPLCGIDVWEHAYYLQYENVRLDYVNNFFKIINWAAVEKKYLHRNN